MPGALVRPGGAGDEGDDGRVITHGNSSGAGAAFGSALTHPEDEFARQIHGILTYLTASRNTPSGRIRISDSKKRE
jgi:hypothetical protein